MSNKKNRIFARFVAMILALAMVQSTFLSNAMAEPIRVCPDSNQEGAVQANEGDEGSLFDEDELVGDSLLDEIVEDEVIEDEIIQEEVAQEEVTENEIVEDEVINDDGITSEDGEGGVYQLPEDEEAATTPPPFPPTVEGPGDISVTPRFGIPVILTFDFQGGQINYYNIQRMSFPHGLGFQTLADIAPLYQPVREGFLFIGWAASPDYQVIPLETFVTTEIFNTITIYQDDDGQHTAHASLYAVWGYTPFQTEGYIITVSGDGYVTVTVGSENYINNFTVLDDNVDITITLQYIRQGKYIVVNIPIGWEYNIDWDNGIVTVTRVLHITTRVNTGQQALQNAINEAVYAVNSGNHNQTIWGEPLHVIEISRFVDGSGVLNLDSPIVLNHDNESVYIILFASAPVIINAAPNQRHFVSNYRLALAGQMILEGNNLGGGVFIQNGAFSSGLRQGPWQQAVQNEGIVIDNAQGHGITFRNNLYTVYHSGPYFLHLNPSGFLYHPALAAMPGGPGQGSRRAGGYQANAVHSNGTIALFAGSAVENSGNIIHTGFIVNHGRTDLIEAGWIFYEFINYNANIGVGPNSAIRGGNPIDWHLPPPTPTPPTVPGGPDTDQDEPNIDTDEPITYPDEPITYPDEPNIDTDEPITYPDEPNIDTDEPITYPDEPNTNTDTDADDNGGDEVGEDDITPPQLSTPNLVPNFVGDLDNPNDPQSAPGNPRMAPPFIPSNGQPDIEETDHEPEDLGDNPGNPRMAPGSPSQPNPQTSDSFNSVTNLAGIAGSVFGIILSGAIAIFTARRRHKNGSN